MMLLVFTTASGRLWAQGENIEDSEITGAIEGEFWKDQAVSSNQIDVDTEEGVVTLSGTVGNLLAKERAEKIAEAIVGVRAVVNRVDVEPGVSKTDLQLRSDVRGALLDDPATEAYEVQVKVDDGVVTLSGTVDSWQEKQLCGTVAKGVTGVRDIKNMIAVEYKADRPDYEIQKEVEKRLANDVKVDDALIEVEVEDGEVILSGSVGSAQEKTQARMDAWVGGVDDVTTENLEVQWWARDEMRRTRMYSSRSDREIEQAVKDSFVYDPRVYSFNIDVDSTEGVVVLSGVVNNLQAKKAAERDAKNTAGVKYVRNNIKVRPDVIPENENLESRVSTALLKDAYVERFDINVSASSGIVYLSGKVNTSWEKTQAERVAEGVQGVVDVVNNISYEHEWTWKPDEQIREDVKDQLWWSPFVDKDDVTVDVDNGIVTLAGTVDTYGERQAAEDNAYEGGAKEVVNNLVVSYPYHSPYDYDTFNWPYYNAP
jgi:osmotically-inducible protein OsmY